MLVTPVETSRHSRTGAGLSCALRKKKKAAGFKFLPFQKRFLEKSLKPDIAISCLSTPRAEGKSLLASRLLNEALPGGRLYVPGYESILLSGSMNQSRSVFKFLRELYPCPDHQEKRCPHCNLRWMDSLQRIGLTHWPTETRITVRGNSGRLALGLVNCPIIVGDEPSAWATVGGQEMIDALLTSAGKTRQLLCLIGTLAPGAEGGWWRELIESGSQPGIYVQTLRGNLDKWNTWREVMRVNPVARVNTVLRTTLRRELQESRRDSRAKARFLSYRLNIPTADSTSVLLTVDEFKRVATRDVPMRVGRPIVGVDLGAGRAWSAACAVWPNGYTESFALAPGTPSIEQQEKRDRVPRGTYAKLVSDGVLKTDGDRRVPRVSELLRMIRSWRHTHIVCDRFRLSELKDAAGGSYRIESRGQRWSEASEDIRALRSAALDGPMSIALRSRSLIAASLAASKVESDQQGSLRLIKSSNSNTGRDDLCVAWALACGARARAPIRQGGLTRSLVA